MAKAATIRRPTNVMMQAVNLHLQGKEKNALAVLKDNAHDQHTKANLEHFARVRQEKGLGPYDLDKPRAPRGSRTAAAVSGDIVDVIDGRTKISTLVRLEARVKEVLADKDKGEVTKVRKALENVEKLRDQLEEAEALIA